MSFITLYRTWMYNTFGFLFICFRELVIKYLSNKYSVIFLINNLIDQSYLTKLIKFYRGCELHLQTCKIFIIQVFQKKHFSQMFLTQEYAFKNVVFQNSENKLLNDILKMIFVLKHISLVDVFIQKLCNVPCFSRQKILKKNAIKAFEQNFPTREFWVLNKSHTAKITYYKTSSN